MKLLDINHNESNISKLHELTFSFSSNQLYDCFEMIQKNLVDTSSTIPPKDTLELKNIIIDSDYDKVSCNSFVEKEFYNLGDNDTYYPLDGELTGFSGSFVKNDLGFKNNSKLFLKKDCSNKDIVPYYDIFIKSSNDFDYDYPVGVTPNYNWQGAMSYTSPIHNYIKYEDNQELPFWLQYLHLDNTVKADILNATPFNTDEAFYIQRLKSTDVDTSNNISFKRDFYISDDGYYTYSVYCKCLSNCILKVYIDEEDSDLIEIEDFWKRISKTKSLIAGVHTINIVIPNYHNNDINMSDCIRFAGMLLEKSEKPTSYVYNAISYRNSELEYNFYQSIILKNKKQLKSIMFTRYLTSLPCFDMINGVSIGYNEDGFLQINDTVTDVNFSYNVGKKEIILINFYDNSIKYESFSTFYTYAYVDVEYTTSNTVYVDHTELCQSMLGTKIEDNHITTYDSIYRDVICSSEHKSYDTNLIKTTCFKIADNECKIISSQFLEVS